jgi:hypothetical protein
MSWRGVALIDDHAGRDKTLPESLGMSTNHVQRIPAAGLGYRPKLTSSSFGSRRVAAQYFHYVERAAAEVGFVRRQSPA